MKNNSDKEFSEKLTEFIGKRVNILELGILALCIVLMAFFLMFRYVVSIYPFIIPLALFAILYMFSSFYFEEKREMQHPQMQFFFQKISYLSLSILSLGLLFFILEFPRAKMLMVVGTIAAISAIIYYIYQIITNQYVFFRLLVRLLIFAVLGVTGIYYA